MIQFHALGGLTVTVDDREIALGGPRQRRLLALFLIHRNTVVSVDRLIDVVFDGEPTPAAGTTLRSYVARLRKVMAGAAGAPTLVTQAPGYVMSLDDDVFDVARFERGVSDAAARAAQGDAPGAASTLRSALALWQGDPYAEFADEDWARPEAQRLVELRLSAQERLFEAELDDGRAAELVPEIEALVREHPTREGLRAQLMVALYRAGRQADALRSYQELREVLLDELGLDPTPALQELEQRILAHDERLRLAEPAGRPLRGYLLGDRLGTGRDGTVQAARLPGLERDLAIRVVTEDVADEPGFVRSFEATARRLAALDHPAMVAIHDYWREPGGAYVVVRRLHGGSLADRLARGPSTEEQGATFVDRVGGALAAVHEAGLVHGRITPAGVLYDDRGDPCLADFVVSAATATTNAHDDVRAFAAVVRTCLDGGSERLAAVLDGGVGPSPPSMAELVAEIRSALAGGPPRRVAPPTNPYKGLRPFDEADTDDFFGREAVTDEIIRRLGGAGATARLVLVVGGSGTGKSSAVRAGLLPRVRAGVLPGSGSWFVATMLPGSAPFAALAECLRQVAVVDPAGLDDARSGDIAAIDRMIRRVVPEGGQMLLVVDQLEELFTAAPEGEQRAFLGGLLHALSAPDSRLRVVATLRADFYDRPLAVPGFGAAVERATVTIPAMTASELDAAIVGPAERVGRRVEVSLVAELVSAVADEPGALPALQFTLYQLASRGDEVLTLAAYRALGQLDGAIALRAEDLYRSSDAAEQVTVQRLFERLVVVTPNEEPTRRYAARTELVATADARLDAAIDRWTQARLLSVDRHPQSRVPTVELAHEALLREWPRLRDWIEASREELVVLGHLRGAAASWLEVGRDSGALYRGARLDLVADVVDRGGRTLPPLEAEFLTRSLEARDRELAEVADRAERQTRANRRLRVQLVAIGVALVATLVGGLVAIDQRGQAQQERRVATARELAAASEASVADDPERAVLLALAAVDVTRSRDEQVLPEAEAALHQAVSTSRVVLSVPDIGGSIDWSPDGRLFATEGPEESGLVDVRDVATGESVRAFPGHDIDVNDVAFNADGSLLATTGDDGALRVWNPHTGELVQSFESADDVQVWGPSFSADGTRVAAGFGDLIVRVFDVATGDTLAEIPAEGCRATSLNADGTQVAVANQVGPSAPVFDVASGRVLYTVGDEDGFIRDLAFSPDGRWIASTTDGAVTRVSEADSGRSRFTITAHTAWVNALAWSPDSTRLATASEDGTARITDIDAGGVRESVVLSGEDTGNGLYAVAFSPDGGRLMTGDSGLESVKIWDVSVGGGAEWANVAGAWPFAGVAFLPGGRQLAAADERGGVTIWDVGGAAGSTARRIPVTVPDGDEVTGFALSDDARRLALVWNESRVEIVDLAGDAPAVAVPADVTGDVVTAMAWTHAGDRLAIAASSEDGPWVTVVDEEGSERARLVEEDDAEAIAAVSFSGDDRLLAQTRVIPRNVSSRMGARIWDWEQEEPLRTIRTPALAAAFDPSGSRLATLRQLEGFAEVWDAATGEALVQIPAVARFNAAAFSADGARLATAGADGAVRLWDPDTGEATLVLRGHETAVQGIAFSPDGSRLASLGDDGVIRVWALDLDDLIAIAEDRVTRSLTDAECRQYLHVEACDG